MEQIHHLNMAGSIAIRKRSWGEKNTITAALRVCPFRIPLAGKAVKGFSHITNVPAAICFCSAQHITTNYSHVDK